MGRNTLNKNNKKTDICVYIIYNKRKKKLYNKIKIETFIIKQKNKNFGKVVDKVLKMC